MAQHLGRNAAQTRGLPDAHWPRLDRSQAAFVVGLGGAHGMLSGCSGGDGVALFPNRLGHRITRLRGVHLNAVLAAVDAHLGLWVERFDGAGHGFFAVAAGHALHGEGLVHREISKG